MAIEFKSAFFKKPRHVWANAQNAQQSIILSAMPEGELLSFNAILGNVIHNKDNSLLKNQKDVEFYLDECIKQKWVIELHGERLYQWLKPYLK